MPANTPNGLPYPLPTEPVAEGAQAIRNLAEAVDSTILAPPRRPAPLIGGWQHVGVTLDGQWHWFGDASASDHNYFPGFFLDPAEFGPGRLYTQVRFVGTIVCDAGNGSQAWSIHLSTPRAWFEGGPQAPFSYTLALNGGGAPPAGQQVLVIDSGYMTCSAIGGVASAAGLFYMFDYVGAAPGPIHLGLNFLAR